MSNKPFPGKIVTMPHGERYRAKRDVLYLLNPDLRCEACEASPLRNVTGLPRTKLCVQVRCWGSELNECYVWERLTSEENENDSNESSRK